MKKIIFSVLVCFSFSQALYADFWSRLVTVKHVDDSQESRYQYGYQTGRYDGNNRGDAPLTNDPVYNSGYQDGYVDSIRENLNRNQGYQPQVIIVNDRGAYRDRDYHNDNRRDQYNEAPHYELFHSN